ncbi:MAG: hypothetical protein QXY76_03240 [Nitrososphaeria archaeon]
MEVTLKTINPQNLLLTREKNGKEITFLLKEITCGRFYDVVQKEPRESEESVGYLCTIKTIQFNNIKNTPEKHVTYRTFLVPLAEEFFPYDDGIVLELINTGEAELLEDGEVKKLVVSKEFQETYSFHFLVIGYKQRPFNVHAVIHKGHLFSTDEIGNFVEEELELLISQIVSEIDLTMV